MATENKLDGENPPIKKVWRVWVNEEQYFDVRALYITDAVQQLVSYLIRLRNNPNDFEIIRAEIISEPIEDV